MKRPIQTVKHMEARYRKYQVFTFACALLTLLAIMLTAFSEVRIKALKTALESQTSALSDFDTAEAEKELAEIRDALDHANRQLDHANRQLDHANRQLVTEKEHMSLLQKKIDDLERLLAEKIKVDAARPSTSVSLQSNPEVVSTPVAPSTKTPLQTETKDAVPAATTAEVFTPAPEAVSSPQDSRPPVDEN